MDESTFTTPMMRTLIVEDDAPTRQFYERVAHSIGLDPVSFSDAEAAWEACQLENFPIMILDWLLPQMHGLELCRKVRSRPEGIWSFILVATVKSREEDLRAVLEAGADDYIPKPMDLGLLKLRLEIAKNSAVHLLERKQTETQLQDLQSRMNLAEKLMSVQGMVSGVSHELNNPLQGILGLAELLSTEAKEEKTRKDLDTIRQLAEQCKTIVHDLLIFSEGEQGIRTEMNINTLIGRFLDIWEKKLVAENICVQKIFDERSPHVRVDVGRMNQVFFHLCQNAVQAMPEGGKLTIETEMGALSSGEMVEIRFSDTGKGISMNNLNRVFDPFFTTKEVGQGKGLGLSVCHGIVREYGGQIVAESPGEGCGSTILVRLPIVPITA